MRKRRRILLGVVVGVATVAAVVGTVLSVTPDAPPVQRASAGSAGSTGAAGANLWVRPGGGNCSRRAVPGAEVPARACGSLDAAYRGAHCGDTVDIAAGDYSAAVQNIQDVRSLDSCSSSVVFQPAPGVSRSSVIFGTIEAGAVTDSNTNGASNWTLRNVTVTRVVTLLPPAANITISRIHGPGFYIDGAHNVTVENSTLGPCYSGKILTGHCANNVKLDTGWTQASGQAYTTTDVTFIHNTIHDFINNAPCPPCTKAHFECMFLAGGANINIDANKFVRCQNYGIFMANFRGAPFTNLVIQNNSFAKTLDIAGSTQYAVDFGGTGSESNILIRHNRFAANDGITADGVVPPGTNDRVIGNIGGNNFYNNSVRGCVPGVHYAHNVWNAVRCGSTDTVVRRLP